MSCKNCMCSKTEEVKPVKATTSCMIPVAKGPSIAFNVKTETLERLQRSEPNTPINKLLEELIESFDW